MLQVSIVTFPRPWGQQSQQTRSQAADRYVCFDRYWSLYLFQEKFSLGSVLMLSRCFPSSFHVRGAQSQWNSGFSIWRWLYRRLLTEITHRVKCKIFPSIFQQNLHQYINENTGNAYTHTHTHTHTHNSFTASHDWLCVQYYRHLVRAFTNESSTNTYGSLLTMSLSSTKVPYMFRPYMDHHEGGT